MNSPLGYKNVIKCPLGCPRTWLNWPKSFVCPNSRWNKLAVCDVIKHIDMPPRMPLHFGWDGTFCGALLAFISCEYHDGVPIWYCYVHENVIKCPLGCPCICYNTVKCPLGPLWVKHSCCMPYRAPVHGWNTMNCPITCSYRYMQETCPQGCHCIWHNLMCPYRR